MSVRVLFCRMAATGADESRIQGNEVFSLSVQIRLSLCRMRERESLILIKHVVTASPLRCGVHRRTRSRCDFAQAIRE